MLFLQQFVFLFSFFIFRLICFPLGVFLAHTTTLTYTYIEKTKIKNIKERLLKLRIKITHKVKEMKAQ